MTKLKLYLFKLSLTAILTALAIVLNSFLSIKIGEQIKITLYGFPLIILGLFSGPLFGFIGGLTCAIVNDIIGYGISLGTIWWSIAPISWALIPALFRKFYFKNNNIKYYKGLIIVLISAFSAFLFNNLAFFLDLKVFGYDYGDLLIMNVIFRLISLLISTELFSILLYFIAKPLNLLYGKRVRHINNKDESND